MIKVSDGSQIKTFWLDTTGAFQAVAIPADSECKTVYIQVHDGDNTVFDTSVGNVGFLISSESDGTGWARVSPHGIGVSIGKIEAVDGGVIGYVKAAAGNKISVMMLY